MGVGGFSGDGFNLTERSLNLDCWKGVHTSAGHGSQGRNLDYHEKSLCGCPRVRYVSINYSPISYRALLPNTNFENQRTHATLSECGRWAVFSADAHIRPLYLPAYHAHCNRLFRTKRPQARQIDIIVTCSSYPRVIHSGKCSGGHLSISLWSCPLCHSPFRADINHTFASSLSKLSSSHTTFLLTRVLD